MYIQPRETIYQALWELLLAGLMVSPAQQGSTPVWLPGSAPTADKPIAWASRRWIPTSRADIQPAMILKEVGEADTWAAYGEPPIQTLIAHLFFYTRDAVDPNVISAANLNSLLDALDTALAPLPFKSEQTLSAYNGGSDLVQWVRKMGHDSGTVYDATQDMTQSALIAEIHMLGTV